MRENVVMMILEGNGGLGSAAPPPWMRRSKFS